MGQAPVKWVLHWSSTSVVTYGDTESRRSQWVLNYTYSSTRPAKLYDAPPPWAARLPVSVSACWETIGRGDGNRGFPDRGERGTGVSVADIFQLAQPPLPERLTPQVLREAIARTLTSRVKAYDIADECVRLGLPPERQGENPWDSKWNYVEPRLRHRKLAELLAIAEKVTDVYDNQVLDRLLTLAGASGVSGEMKNLIFASTGPKPKIVLATRSTTTWRSRKTASTAWSTTGRWARKA